MVLNPMGRHSCLFKNPIKCETLWYTLLIAVELLVKEFFLVNTATLPIFVAKRNVSVDVLVKLQAHGTKQLMFQADRHCCCAPDIFVMADLTCRLVPRPRLVCPVTWHHKRNCTP